MTNTKIPIEISARHLHITRKDFEKLFGKNKELTIFKNLSQPKEFASNEFVTLSNGDKKLEKVRILGPFREKSQIEISMTDAYFLKLNPLPKIKISGDLKGAKEILVKNKNYSIKLPCIIAKRHLHLTELDAKNLKIKNNQKISIKVKGERELIFKEIIARVSDKYKLSLHLDTDEGNSAGIFVKTFGEIIRHE